jgi:hypothetical protein
VLPIIVYDGSNKTIGLEHGKGFKCLSLGHEIRCFHVFFSGKDIVHLASGKVVGNLPVLVDRQHYGKHVAKIGCRLEEYTSFMEGFAYELILFIVEFEYGFLKIPNAAMHKLGRLGRSSL